MSPFLFRKLQTMADTKMQFIIEKELKHRAQWLVSTQMGILINFRV